MTVTLKPLSIDVHSQAYKRDPFPTLAAMIEQGPLIRVNYPLFGEFLMVTTYEAASELLRDREQFVRDPRTAGLKTGANLPWWIPKFATIISEPMINRDEPDHRRLRSLVEQAFARRSVEQLRPHFEQLANRHLDEMEKEFKRTGQPVDLVAGLARPFPLAVICELLGLPEEDRSRFTRQAESFGRSSSLVSIGKMLFAMWKITGYIRRQIADVRRNPRPGLITELVAAEHEGERLTENEMIGMVILLLFAGHVTTVHLIGGGVHVLFQHPEQLTALAADWTLKTRAVNEMLRYLSPVQMTKPMMPIRPLTWRGVEMKPPERVVAFLASANADPARFDRPEVFDIHRDPNPHMAFGAGIHVCLGWKLAVAEGEIALQQLLTRFPKLEVAVSPESAKWSRQNGTRGMEELPVRLW